MLHFFLFILEVYTSCHFARIRRSDVGLPEITSAYSHNQHGFLSRHSTSTQLLENNNDWSIALRNQHAVDAVCFDFDRAFDSVSHIKLLLKLAAYGITVIYSSVWLISCIIVLSELPNDVSSFKYVSSMAWERFRPSFVFNLSKSKVKMLL